MPGCDGSSRAFVEAIQNAGACEQDALRPCLAPTEPIRVGDERSWVEARPPSGESRSVHLRYELDYGADSPIGRQSFALEVTPESFASQLASARTFVLVEEAEWLKAQGLGQRVGHGDLLVFDHRGVLGNTLRFPDECVRHKTLDLVGDLALMGCDLAAEVVAYRSGHRLNAQLASALLARCRNASRSQAA
jgi:UDP-3-O-acyl-N-acetylglucosamine deacetylase